jgi:predicted hydrocarbon binding protein
MAEKTVSNIIIRILLDSTEEVIGNNGLKSLLSYTGMSFLLEQKPEYTLDKDYSDDDLNNITSKFFDFIGPGAKALFRLVGKTTVTHVIKSGALNSVTSLSGEEKFFGAMEMYAMATGKGKMKWVNGKMVYDNPDCASCAYLTTDVPVCTIINGIMDELLSWAGLSHMKSAETLCKAMEDDRCYFEVVPC